MILYLQEKYQMPLNLPDKEEMSREEFLAFCEANSHLRIERDENKQIFIMPPVFGETGRKHIKIASAIENWNSQTNLGVTFDSSTGFDLPDGSMRSPDAAWIQKEKWEVLSETEKNAFISFAPDFVVEILSSTDRLTSLKIKMTKWIQNGTLLAWLIDTKDESVFIYRINGTIDKVTGFHNLLSGENVLPDFEFDLNVLK